MILKIIITDILKHASITLPHGQGIDNSTPLSYEPK